VFHSLTNLGLNLKVTRFLTHFFQPINYNPSFDANLKTKNKQIQITCPELNLRQIKTESFPCTRCDGVWGSGDTDPLVLILNFRTRRVDWSAVCHCHRTPGERTQRRFRRCLEFNRHSTVVQPIACTVSRHHSCFPCHPS
jgi:hypothetical protein